MGVPIKGYVGIDYLNKVARVLEQMKQRTYDYMNIQAGDAVLDIGCGPATDTLPLAAIVGPEGKVFGVDNDQEMIQVARKRAQEQGVSDRVEHYHAHAYQLPFATNMFDACRSERLFQHLLQPALALEEIVRVTRTEGYVVLLDMDWGSFSIDSVQTSTERLLSTIIAEELHHNGYAGRQLYRLFQRHPHLTNISIEIIPVVLTDYEQVRSITPLVEAEGAALARNRLSREELSHWHNELEQMAAQGTFFFYGDMFLVSGQVMK